MIEVRFFGTARLNLNMKYLELDAKSVSELLKKIEIEANVPPKFARNYLIYVNEVNIDKLKRFRTKLNDGDKIMILSPSSGG
ncbi:MAG: MoaD/ThiS family protein [Clostridia bacterium]